MNRSSTYLHLFARQLEERPDQPAFTFLADGTGEGNTWTYADLHRQASSVARHLSGTVRANDRVILMTPPGLEYIAGFFGCMYAGVIPVPAYPPFGVHIRDSFNRLVGIALDAGTTTALVTRDILAGMQAFDFGGVSVTWLAIDDAAELDQPTDIMPPVGRTDDVAFLQYTSGSTGDPKGVVVTQGNLAANIGMIESEYEVRARVQRAVSWLPPYHDMGLIGMILAASALGVPSTIMPPSAFLRRPVRWLRVISQGGGTISAAPNFAFDLCASKVTDEELEELDLARWEIAINGAEPVRASTIERFVDRFSTSGFQASSFYPAYGLAEATLMVATGPLGSQSSVIDVDAEGLRDGILQSPNEGVTTARLVTCGRPPQPSSVEIVDQTTRQKIEDGRIGEIVISGSHVAHGYWGGHPENENFWGDSVASGDLGALFNGELVVTGRMKDVLVLKGRNYYPQDIETSAETAHHALRRGSAAAFTVAHEAREVLVIVLEVAPAAEDQHLTVVEQVRRSITSSHGISASCVVLVSPGRVPKTSSGKIRRGETRRRHLDGLLEPVFTWADGRARQPTTDL